MRTGALPPGSPAADANKRRSEVPFVPSRLPPAARALLASALDLRSLARLGAICRETARWILTDDAVWGEALRRYTVGTVEPWLRIQLSRERVLQGSVDPPRRARPALPTLASLEAAAVAAAAQEEADEQTAASRRQDPDPSAAGAEGAEAAGANDAPGVPLPLPLQTFSLRILRRLQTRFRQLQDAEREGKVLMQATHAAREEERRRRRREIEGRGDGGRAGRPPQDPVPPIADPLRATEDARRRARGGFVPDPTRDPFSAFPGPDTFFPPPRPSFPDDPMGFDRPRLPGGPYRPFRPPGVPPGARFDPVYPDTGGLLGPRGSFFPGGDNGAGYQPPGFPPGTMIGGDYDREPFWRPGPDHGGRARGDGDRDIDPDMFSPPPRRDPILGNVGGDPLLGGMGGAPPQPELGPELGAGPGSVSEPPPVPAPSSAPPTAPPPAAPAPAPPPPFQPMRSGFGGFGNFF
jgi:hypothetical protein